MTSAADLFGLQETGLSRGSRRALLADIESRLGETEALVEALRMLRELCNHDPVKFLPVYQLHLIRYAAICLEERQFPEAIEAANAVRSLWKRARWPMPEIAPSQIR